MKLTARALGYLGYLTPLKKLSLQQLVALRSPGDCIFDRFELQYQDAALSLRDPIL